MPIRPPEITLSSDDRRLLVLLARLIASEPIAQTNFLPDQEIVLSNAEASELIELLEEFASSKRFVDGSYFIEEMFSGAGSEDPVTREIYLKWRKRNGRSRVMASSHWQEFLVRLGISNNHGGYLAGGYVIQARRMTINKFLNMEKILLEGSSLNPRVCSLVLRLVTAQSTALESLRNGHTALPRGSLTTLPKRIANEIEESRHSPIGVKPMSNQKIAGIMTIVIDMSSLFTTRDWNVVGTLSSMAGALIAASE